MLTDHSGGDAGQLTPAQRCCVYRGFDDPRASQQEQQPAKDDDQGDDEPEELEDGQRNRQKSDAEHDDEGAGGEPGPAVLPPQGEGGPGAAEADCWTGAVAAGRESEQNSQQQQRKAGADEPPEQDMDERGDGLAPARFLIAGELGEDWRRFTEPDEQRAADAQRETAVSHGMNRISRLHERQEQQERAEQPDRDVEPADQPGSMSGDVDGLGLRDVRGDVQHAIGYALGEVGVDGFERCAQCRGGVVRGDADPRSVVTELEEAPVHTGDDLADRVTDRVRLQRLGDDRSRNGPGCCDHLARRRQLQGHLLGDVLADRRLAQRLGHHVGEALVAQDPRGQPPTRDPQQQQADAHHAQRPDHTPRPRLPGDPSPLGAPELARPFDD